MDIENIIVREYEASDLPGMTRIWNEVIEEGNAFPQIDTLDDENAAEFFHHKPFAALLRIKSAAGYLGFTYCTQTTLADAAIFQTQAMLFHLKPAACI